MKDVAKEAGVSLGTVSNVLNNLPSVSEENRQRVFEAIDKLKYRPNSTARALKTKTSRSLGLIIPNITNPFYPELARGAEDAARKYGYSIFLCNNDRDIEKEREYVNILSEKNVDGLILVKPQITSQEINELKERCNIVLVDVDDVFVQGCDSINVDDYMGSINALEYLYKLGHRKIAFISGMLESKSSTSRMSAYMEFLKKHEIKLEEELIIKGKYDWISGYDCTIDILKRGHVPTAIFAANDLMAIGAMKAVREMKLSVPKDISVIGFDDIEMSSLCTPQLTTVRQPKYEIGVKSVEMIFERFKSRNSNEIYKDNTVMMETELVIRESVSKLK
jgi:DNA-binding LacI/PurR family transcriptional regulator